MELAEINPVIKWRNDRYRRVLGAMDDVAFALEDVQRLIKTYEKPEYSIGVFTMGMIDQKELELAHKHTIDALVGHKHNVKRYKKNIIAKRWMI